MPESLSPEVRAGLVDCAMGRRPADLVVRQGKWVAVQTGEVVPRTDVAVLAGRIAYIGDDATHCIGPLTEVVEARGRYLVPGLIEGHVHVESSMLTVTEFVRAIAPHGTTGAIIDPHEMANVFGLRGVRMMLEEASQQPISLWIEVPSCVPSAPGLETPGASLSPEEVAEALAWEGVIGLGEVMDYNGVAANAPKMRAEINAARRLGKVVSGHYPSLDLGRAFHAYAAGGVDDDHEGTRKEDAIARARQGMRPMLRYGSGWHDVAAQVRAITEDGLDPRHFALVTDDAHAETLLREGHMDRVVRHAIQSGLPAMTAIQMATLNPAEHFGLSREVGLLAPGRRADMLLVANLESMEVETVFAAGRVIAHEGAWSVPLAPRPIAPEFGDSVRLGRPLAAQDFRVASAGNPSTQANVIGVLENQAPTEWLTKTLAVGSHGAQLDAGQDVAKVAVVDRHHGSGRVKTAFVSGFGFGPHCAVASTVAHDSHNLIVVGTDEEQMANAANALAEAGGGMLVVREGRVLASVELPLGGLMSNKPAAEVAAAAQRVLDAFRACGCRLNNPNMQLTLLGLAVIPRLRLTDLGLVDVEHGTFVPVVSP
jgi:adenine deaminase